MEIRGEGRREGGAICVSLLLLFTSSPFTLRSPSAFDSIACLSTTSHKRLSLQMKPPTDPPPLSLPRRGRGSASGSHHQSSYRLLRGEEETKTLMVFYRDFIRGEKDEKRRRQSCLRYIYTIGCKSFLMGSRVQSWGRDYQGRSGSAVTCICPGVALCTPPRCTLARRGETAVRARVRRAGLRRGGRD